MKSADSGHPIDTPVQEYRFGPFRLDVRRRRLWTGNQLVALTPKALDTLLALVKDAGQVVEKDDLLRAVWPDTFVAEETLTQNIATIRRALSDSSERPQYIATVPRRGYRFVAPLDTVGCEVDVTVPTPHAVKTDTIPASGVSNRYRFLSVAMGLAGLIGVGLGIAAYLQARRIGTQGGEWQINPPPNTVFRSGGVLSPDGRSVAFVAIDERGETTLWVQPLGTLAPLQIPGTQGAQSRFWTPDGKAILFTANGKLKRIDLAEKTPQTLADIETATITDQGGAVNNDNVVLCRKGTLGPIYRLKEDGRFEPVTRLRPGERTHLWPSFLPDGRHFLFRVAARDKQQSGTFVGSLGSLDERTRLDGVDSAAQFVPPGFLLFVREGNLVAQRFDVDRLRLEGVPTIVASNVTAPNERLGLTFNAAAGIVTYIAGGPANHLVWFNRDGSPLGVLDASGDWNSPSVSPDDSLVVAQRTTTDIGAELWILPTASGTPWHLATGRSLSTQAAWSHDGTRIAFTSGGDLLSIAVGGGQAEVLLKASSADQPVRLQDWAKDGRSLVYYIPDPKTGMDLWSLSMADRTSRALLQSPADEAQAQFSPDGHWLAYTSNDTSRFEVYVDRFPAQGATTKISLNGGTQPQWRPDGTELYYLSEESDVMAVEVHGGALHPFGTPQRLFHISLNQNHMEVRNSYTVTRDGRFLFASRPSNPPPITVRLDWTAALSKNRM